MKSKDMQDALKRIEELERKVRDLQMRPPQIVTPYPYYVPYPVYPAPQPYPYHPWPVWISRAGSGIAPTGYASGGAVGSSADTSYLTFNG